MRKLFWHVGMFGCSGAMALMAVGWLTDFSHYSIVLPVIFGAVGIPALWIGDPDDDDREGVRR